MVFNAQRRYMLICNNNKVLEDYQAVIDRLMVVIGFVSGFYPLVGVQAP